MESQQSDRRENALGMLHVLSDDMLCKIISLLLPRDIGKLACVSSVFNILCDEEPLWMELCLEKHQGPLDYKGSWKLTALAKLALTKDVKSFSKRPRHFPGFSSLFLYRRWYRCHVALEGFALDDGAVERRNCLTAEEFSANHDGKKPVLLTDLMDDWPASKKWSLDQLIEKCGDAEFKVTQPHGKAVPMNMKDFAGYMDVQHDEEPLYIFDPQFGEAVPELLNDYKVPTLFSDDLFSVLSDRERPPYRWLVLGPARSGASWHVDPSLTSAWNSLLSGRKRWALYPPGKVPPEVTLDVDEDDGSVHYDGPNSLQWWLDVYPHLEEADKPLECTQLAGETIYVPSGWWHCVLNIDASVAVTQNFVNVNNLEIVCMDLAPGYRHRAIARAGLIALDGGQMPAVDEMDSNLEHPVVAKTIQEKRQPSQISADLDDVVLTNAVRRAGSITDKNLLLALDTLKIRPEEDRAPSGKAHKDKSMGEKMMRKWLRTLWVERPELQQTIWKGACLALDAGAWLLRINVICTACGFLPPAAEEQLPVGNGTNPVFFVGDHVIKLYIQDGPAAAIDALGSELEFYALLKESGSPFQDVVPEFITSGILYPAGEDYRAVPWDGTGDCPLVYTGKSTAGRKRGRESERTGKEGRFRTRWSTNRSETSKTDETDSSTATEARLWPYLVTRRCPGRTVSDLRKNMTENEIQSLAAFLGKQVRFLHTLPLPAPEMTAWDNERSEESADVERSRDFKEAKHDSGANFGHEYLAQPRNGTLPATTAAAVASRPQPEAPEETFWEVPHAWDPFVSFLRSQRKAVSERLKEWRSLPDHLLEQVDAYLPTDPVVLIGNTKVLNGVVDVSKPPVWLHMDLMTDNILAEEEARPTALEAEDNPSDCASDHGRNGTLVSEEGHTMLPGYIIDYGDIIHGDPLYDLLPLHLDVLNLEGRHLESFFKSYRLPLSNSSESGTMRHSRGAEGPESHRQYALSYCAMCYCLLHELDVMSNIFKRRQDIRKAESFEEIEHKIWGVLNDYVPEDYLA